MVTQSRQNMPDPDTLINELSAELSSLETRRQELRHKTRSQLIILAGAAVLLAFVLALMLSEDNQGLAFLVIIVAVIGVVMMVLRRQRHWQQQVFDTVMPVICNGYEQLSYTPQVKNAGKFVQPWEKLELFGRSHRQQVKHHLQGSHRGTGFEVAEARLSRKSGGKNSSNNSVFNGLLLRIQMPIDLPSRIIIRPQGLFFSRLRGMSNVTMGSAEFDKRFTVSHEDSDAEGEARVRSVINPTMQQALLEISTEEGGLVNERGAISAGLIYDSLYLTLTRAHASKTGKIKFEKPRAFLDVGLYFREKSDLQQAVRDMLHDVGIVYRIIDRLQHTAASPQQNNDALWQETHQGPV